MVSADISRVLFGLIEFAVGFVILVSPQRVRRLSLSREVRVDQTRLPRDVVIVWRLIALGFMVMGGVVMYSALMPTAAPPVPVVNDLGLVLTAVVWTIVGVALVIWPARMRSLTNPDWRRYEDWPLAGTSLAGYRITGLVLGALGIGLMFVLLDRVH